MYIPARRLFSQTSKEYHRTYYNSGLTVLKKSYASVLEAYPEQVISMAYHDYRALKEVLKKRIKSYGRRKNF